MTQSAPAAVRSRDIRVMVVDDSAVVRGLITRHLNAEAGIEVGASAATGELALAELSRREVDVVVLDIEMPVMDGLTALREIVARHPGVRVVMASTLTRRNAEISMKALHLGASDYVAKPETGLAGAEQFRQELAAKVRAIAARRPATVSGAPTRSSRRRRPLPDRPGHGPASFSSARRPAAPPPSSGCSRPSGAPWSSRSS